eukprot:gene10493-8459_t
MQSHTHASHGGTSLQKHPKASGLINLTCIGIVILSLFLLEHTFNEFSLRRRDDTLELLQGLVQVQGANHEGVLDDLKLKLEALQNEVKEKQAKGATGEAQKEEIEDL